MKDICMICEKLQASKMSARRDVYSDYYSCISLKLEVDPDTQERTYYLTNERYHEDACSEYKVIIKYCPFCGKELV